MGPGHGDFVRMDWEKAYPTSRPNLVWWISCVQSAANRPLLLFFEGVPTCPAKASRQNESW